MSLGELSAQATIRNGSSSESDELSDNADFDPLSDPLGETLDNSLGGPDHFEQQMMSFSSPLGHTSTPNSSIRSGHEEASGHQNII